ncbi:MAG: disulfide bond formation protein DsbA [Neptuniibacter caesariensis]|uniref:Thiol:disulfide interchange protein n=1 Tax=Neptuniibacter caesariensis TaxID=207954 RepID=A0A2G6JRF6_NEPCE|nr:MAG: disulfide bond formation protein DsbA [Neptuniibacter caesariensis]
MKKFGLMLAAALLLPFMVQAEDYKEGVHYMQVAPGPASNKGTIEVLEMFGYSCPHCNSFEPLIKRWDSNKAEDVSFARVPAAWSPSWEQMARAYYASEVLNTLDKTHEATFQALHVERRRIRNAEEFADFYQNLGVEPEKFKNAFKSFAVETKLRQGKQKMQKYQITGVPAMVVNGKYQVTAAMAGGHQQMLKVVDYLVEKERSGGQ